MDSGQTVGAITCNPYIDDLLHGIAADETKVRQHESVESWEVHSV